MYQDFGDLLKQDPFQALIKLITTVRHDDYNLLPVLPAHAIPFLVWGRAIALHSGHCEPVSPPLRLIILPSIQNDIFSSSWQTLLFALPLLFHPVSLAPIVDSGPPRTS